MGTGECGSDALGYLLFLCPYVVETMPLYCMAQVFRLLQNTQQKICMKTIKILGLSLVAFLALQSCEKEEVVANEPVRIAELTCPGAVFTGSASAGTTYNGVFTVPYSGGDGSTYTSNNGVSSTGVMGLSAILVPGTLATGSGMLTYSVAGTPATGGVAAFVINFGGQTCTVSMMVTGSPTQPGPLGE